MSIAELEARRALLLKSEKEILELGQKTTDEDERELQRANLKTVQDSLKDLDGQLAALRNPRRFGVRQYAARV